MNFDKKILGLVLVVIPAACAFGSEDDDQKAIATPTSAPAVLRGRPAPIAVPSVGQPVREAQASELLPVEVSPATTCNETRLEREQDLAEFVLRCGMDPDDYAYGNEESDRRINSLIDRFDLSRRIANDPDVSSYLTSRCVSLELDDSGHYSATAISIAGSYLDSRNRFAPKGPMETGNPRLVNPDDDPDQIEAILGACNRERSLSEVSDSYGPTGRRVARRSRSCPSLCGLDLRGLVSKTPSGARN